MTKKFFVQVIIVLNLIFSQSVRAEIIQWAFTGDVSSIYGGIETELQSIIPLGSNVSGTISIDLSTPIAPLSGANDPNNYAQYYGAVTNFNLLIGSEFEAGYIANNNDEAYITIQNNNLYDTGNGEVERDLFFMGSMSRGWTSPFVSGKELVLSQLTISDLSASMLSGLEIPYAEQLNAGDGSTNLLRLSYGNISGSVTYIDSSIEIENLSFSTISSVPIPSSIWLFISGFVFLFTKRKKSHNK